MSMDLNWIDIGFIIIFLLSILLGFFRGFVRDVMSLIFLVLAVYLAAKYSTQLTAHFAATSEKTISYLILVGIFILIFVVTIIIGALVSYLLGLVFQLSGLGFINSILGAVFGVVRAGIIAVVIIYLVELTPVQNQQIWRESKGVTYFQPMTNWLVKNVSPSLNTLKDQMNKTIQNIMPMQ